MTPYAKKTIVFCFLAVLLFAIPAAVQLKGQSQAGAKPKLYNTAKQKLLGWEAGFQFHAVAPGCGGILRGRKTLRLCVV